MQKEIGKKVFGREADPSLQVFYSCSLMRRTLNTHSASAWNSYFKEALFKNSTPVHSGLNQVEKV
jgi:hypothetical protein